MKSKGFYYITANQNFTVSAVPEHTYHLETRLPAEEVFALLLGEGSVQ